MYRGFTLAELLIALAILGVIATFTIPKVLQAQQSEQRKSIFREVVANLNEVLYTGMLQGVTWNGILDDQLQLRLNHVKFCEDGVADGCWTHTFPASVAVQATEDAMILHNGAVIGGIGAAANDETVVIDWNGSAAPNTEGEDQMVVRLCYRADGTNCTSGQRPGTVMWSPAGGASSKTLYEQIFTN